eukprot:jgi/Bigna1/72171/fgenesh1_pg.18_\
MGQIRGSTAQTKCTQPRLTASMGDFSVAWVVSDAIRMLMSLSQIILGVRELSVAKQIKGVKPSSINIHASVQSFVSLKQKRSTCWQPYLLLATVASCIQAITGCYLLYVIASLYHQLLNINLAFPQWTTRMFISYALIVILCNAVGTAFIFANNELRWSALRVIGISTSFTIAGGHTLLILANLKRMLLMQNNISHGATANSASKDRSFNAPRKTASFPKIQKLKLQQQQQADPEGTAITNRKPESHTDSLFNSARVHQSEQGSTCIQFPPTLQ